MLGALILLTSAWALTVNSREENRAWMGETCFFVEMIIPLLLVGVFVAGVASDVIPAEPIAEHLGHNTLSANGIAVAFGIFMYFPTLVEVPVLISLVNAAFWIRRRYYGTDGRLLSSRVAATAGTR